jgi:Zn-finger nucleic acid-binding protein
MNCPRDGAPLQSVKLLGMELDKCHHCDGLWLDRGEIERLAASKTTDVEEKLEAQYGDPVVETADVTQFMRCPRCAGRLQQVRYTYVHPIKIDRCESCFGMWVDDGELNTIIGEKKQIDEVTAPSRLRAWVRAIEKQFRGG